jgi:hypothetical protein
MNTNEITQTPPKGMPGSTKRPRPSDAELTDATPPAMSHPTDPPANARGRKQARTMDRELLAGSRRNLEPGFGPTPGTEEDLTGLDASDSD